MLETKKLDPKKDLVIVVNVDIYVHFRWEIQILTGDKERSGLTLATTNGWPKAIIY